MNKSTLVKPDDTSRGEAASVRGVYRLLARLWLRELDREILSKLRKGELADSFAAVGGFVPEDDSHQTIELLAIDFCQLFIGPANHLPPFQSVWETGQLQGKTTSSVANFLAVAGYQQSRLPAGVMLDHLGVQLELMAHILDLHSASTEAEDSKVLTEVAESFFRAHLSWPGDLLRAASARATSQFYRSVADVTGRFLSAERNQLFPT